MGSYLRSGKDPLVVFVSQLGAGAEAWRSVIDLLPDQAVFTYDRPGTGGTAPRTSSDAVTYRVFADELATVLREVGVAGPVVLVGHSVGSHIVRVFAHHYRNQVAGVVLIDGSIPQFALWPDPAFPHDGNNGSGAVIDIIAGHVEILEARPAAVPAVVLTRRRRWWSTGFENIPHPAIDDLWYVNQVMLAGQWKAPLVLTEAGHQIPRESPEVVGFCVSAVVEAARTGRPIRMNHARLADSGGRVVDAS